MIHYVPRHKTRNEEIIAALRKAAGVSDQVNPELAIKKKAADLAIAMALLHGGDWRVEIDHQAGFVLVVPRA